MVAVVVFKFSGMRCQPLRRALVSLRKNHQKFTHKVLKIQPLSFKLHNWALEFFLILIW
ncbi:acetyltransferase [Vibrio cholerae]|nr:acetyltransferase [Vibrio cholerae]